MWTVQEAKSKLSEVLQKARSGEAQFVGAQDPCVVISTTEYEQLTRSRNTPHLGRWLVESAPRIGEIDLPERTKVRPAPFDDWSDEESEE